MKSIAELNELLVDVQNGEIDCNQCRDIIYDLITEAIAHQCAQPRPAVQKFAEQMEKVLQEHEDKGGWDQMNPFDLLPTLKQQVCDLEEAMDDGADDQAIKEATDVANYAMMIADIIKE